MVHYIASGIEEVLDDRLVISRRILDFIEAKMKSTIIRLEDPDAEPSPFGDGDGEAGQTYQARDGWYRDDVVWLRSPVASKLLGGHSKNAFYTWAAEHGIVVRRHDGIKGWTRKVPPKYEKSGVEFNLDRLRAIVHG